MRKFDKVSARLSFSPTYCRAVAENAIKPSVFMCHEARNRFSGSKNVPNFVYFWIEYILGSRKVLNLVYFWVFPKNILASDPPPVAYQ